MKKLGITLFLPSLLVIFMGFKIFAQEPILKAGIAKIDITPTENLYMGGYDESCRADPSNGVDSHIFIRTLVFDDNITKVAFIEVNIVFFPNEDYDQIRQLVSKETGIPFDNILLGVTHNHAAPYPGEENKNSNWYKGLRNKIVLSVKDAIADLEPVKIGGGIGHSHIAMNRRKKMEDTVSYLTFDENNSSQSYGKNKTDNPVKIREMAGVYRLGNNPSGSIDDEVGIVRIDKLSGEPKAVLVNYACHGTSLGGRNNKISGEWMGRMLEYIEEKAPDVIGIFIQGAAGDINPRFVGGLDGAKDNLKNTAELGYEIGREVVRVFNNIKTETPRNLLIKLVHKDIICPRKYAEVMKDFKHTTLSVTTTAIRIGDFSFVAFPGELFHAIGQTVKRSTHSPYPIFFGYCNGYVGYMPTQKAYSQGGYEPTATHFAPVAGKTYVKELDKLLKELY